MVVSGAKLVWFVDVEIPETSARAAIGIAATPGAILAVASTIILLGFGLVMRGCAGHGRAFRILVATLAFRNIVGTALAGYLLDSETLVALMMVCLVGWLTLIFRPQPRSA